MKYSLKSGTAYLDFNYYNRKSIETIPIDDALIVIDQLQQKLVGFLFETDTQTSSEWLDSWNIFRGGFPKFIADLKARDDLQVEGNIFFLSDYHLKSYIIKIPAIAYVDIDNFGNIIGIEFLFQKL